MTVTKIRSLVLSALVLALFASLTVLVACSQKGGTAAKGSSADSSQTAGSYHMAGPAVEVYISREAIANMPAAWVLSTPESAVRSYLSWVSYASRIGQSAVASRTVSPKQEVDMDSYIQYNLEKKQLLDQHLESITFGKASANASRTVLPATESWTYSYLSVDKGNKVASGPFSISYDSTYTLIKNAKGDWVVDKVQAKALGKPKPVGKAQ